jgi:orotate phosphoribosyltransferase-like protein
MKSKKQQEADARQWRRQKILDLKIQGYSQVEIAKELQLSNHVVSSDVSWLREQAAKTIKEVIDREIPATYQEAKETYRAIKYRDWKMANVGKEEKDPKQEIAGLNLVLEATDREVHLATDYETINDALETVES